MVFGIASESNAPATLPELESALRVLLEKHQVPGCGIALVTRSNVIWTAGLGWADLASRRPATDQTLFRIGSTSKGFAALAVLKLAEEGRLSLDDTVRSRAPELTFDNSWETTDPVRIVHLLEHTAGFDDIHLKDYAHNAPRPVGLEEGLAYCAGSRVSRWRPGSRMAYCNAGPPAAALIVQRRVGMDFETYIQRTFFTPLGMHSATYFYPSNTADRLATLYDASGRVPQPYWHILVRPSGSINASAQDMAAYLQFYLRRGVVDGRSLVSAASLERMERPGSGPWARLGLKTGYGLCNYTSQRHGLLWHGHNGGVNGGLTEMAYTLDPGVGYALMINSEKGEALQELAKTLSAFLVRDRPRPALPEPAKVDPALAERYAGYYRLASPRNQTTFFVERWFAEVYVEFGPTNLVLRPFLGPRQTLVAASPRTFRGTDDPWATAVFGEDSGRPAFYDRMNTFVRVPGWGIWVGRGIAMSWLVTTLLTLPYALVWIIGRLRRRWPAGSSFALRGFPLLASLSLVGVGLLLGTALGNTTTLFARFGAPTAWSLGLCMLTLLFAASALAGLWAAWRSRRIEPRRVAWWFGFITSGLHTVVAVFFAVHGAIGWRLWL